MAVIDHEFLKEKVLTYNNWNEKNELINIPICKSWDSFYQSNIKTQFIDGIPKLMVDGV